MDAEKEDLAPLLNEEREEKEKLEEELALRNGQFQSLTDTVFARDKEVASLNQEMERLQKSMSSAKEVGAVEYQKSQAFTDSMTMYFFDGFEAFRRRAMSSYPKVDLTQFEVDDDLQSLMMVEEEERGGELADDEASKVETSIIAETRVEKSLS